jgi:hypothetical protein
MATTTTMFSIVLMLEAIGIKQKNCCGKNEKPGRGKTHWRIAPQKPARVTKVYHSNADCSAG